jgi:lipopolysaccharide transport system permease protein
MSHELTIEAGKGGVRYWKDLWRYRELFYFLAWRDILVRYKQTALGIAWALIQPLLTMAIFTVIFGRIAKLPSDGVPYPVLVFAALVPWQFFAQGLSGASNSLVSSASLISKMYFPRLIIPAGAVVTSAVDFLISAGFLAILMIWYGLAPSARLMTIPFFALLALGAALGAGILLSALTVRYRDFRYIIPFILQLGQYISPVGFSSSVVPDRWRLLYSLNPMVGVIDGFRWAIIGKSELYVPGLILSVVMVITMLALGISYFRGTERTFADVI